MQPSTNLKEVRKLVESKIPDNISAADKAALIAGWEKKAAERTEAIAKEYAVPSEANLVLRFEMKRFGKHWQSYALGKGGKRMMPLLQSVSLLASALSVLQDEMYRQATEGR